jgi:hypothetical protein
VARDVLPAGDWREPCAIEAPDRNQRGANEVRRGYSRVEAQSDGIDGSIRVEKTWSR